MKYLVFPIKCEHAAWTPRRDRRASALRAEAARRDAAGGGTRGSRDGEADRRACRGGAGKDVFVFDTAIGRGQTTQIVDFDVPQDRMRLDDAV